MLCCAGTSINQRVTPPLTLHSLKKFIFTRMMITRSILFFNLLISFASRAQDSISTLSSIDSIDVLLGEFVNVEGGTFKMGSVLYHLDEEKHKVYVSTFNMQVTEVTQGLYEAVMGENPSANKTNANFPVNNVSWEDCQRFIENLNQITGKTYRLPTEAEWEYAAHGGQLSHGYLYSGSDTLNNVAWYLKNSENVFHEVQLKGPNELGLYDMSGNVWEWCQDWYGKYARKKKNPQGPETGTYRVFRGGSVDRDASGCRVTYRCRWEPNRSNAYLGFRLVLE